MIVYDIDTIGSNTLKGAVATHCEKFNLPFEETVKTEHQFHYDSVNQNLPPEDLVADVVWLMKAGATDVALFKKPQKK